MALAALNTKSAAERGVKIDILHPVTGLLLGIRFTVLGVDSSACRKISRERSERRIERAKKNRGQAPIMTADEIEAEALELLVGCTTGWERDVTDAEGNVIDVQPTIELNEGEYLEFTPENARRIYADAGFAWLREQVDREIGDRRNFLPS